MSAEVPAATMVPAHPSNYRTATRLTFSRVVIHITDGRGDPYAVAEMWQEPNHGSSAHFVIGQDGAVLQCVRLKDVAQHAHAANGTSIGIEHCARSPKELGPADMGLPLSEAQYLASARLVAYLCKAAGLEVSRDVIIGHAETDPATTHTDCPGGAFDWGVYMPLVLSAYRDLEASAPLVG